MRRVEPSAFPYSVDTPEECSFATAYQTRTCPCQGFDATPQVALLDSGSVSVASPSPDDSFIHNNSRFSPAHEQARTEYWIVHLFPAAKSLQQPARHGRLRGSSSQLGQALSNQLLVVTIYPHASLEGEVAPLLGDCFARPR